MLHDPISDAIISDIDVSCTLPTWSSAILIQFEGALVISIDNIVMGILFLLFQDVSGPDRLGQDIFHTDKIILIWNLSSKSLFSGFDICPARHHVHEITIVDTHLLVPLKCWFDVPLYISRCVYW